MNNHEKFSRKVIKILENNKDWDEDVVLEIAKLAESLELATGATNGIFEAVGKPYRFQHGS